MTTAQEEVFEKVKQMLGEHFETHVIMVLHKKEDETNCLEAHYGGGFYTALGMIQETAHDFVRDRSQQQENDKEDN